MHGTPHVLATRAALPAEGDERFGDRAAAGRQLAALLEQYRGGPALALALTPGGVAVAGELARALRIGLDVWVAREFCVPGWPGVAAGAVSEGGGMCLNGAALRLPGVATCTIWREAERRQEELAQLVGLYRGRRPLDLGLRCPLILVDDGLRSGLAHLAALRSLRRYHPSACVVATPLAAEPALMCLEHRVDGLACLETAQTGYDDPADYWAYPIEEGEAAAMLARMRGELR